VIGVWTLSVALASAVAAPPAQQAGETIAEIRVHGNHVSSDDEIIKIAGIVIGAPFTAQTLEEVRRRLEQAGRFDDVDVLKRFASIEDPSRIVLVIVVNEGAVRVETPETEAESPRIVRRRGLRNLMFMPILDAEDGYGLTYGVRFAHPGLIGERSRISFPLTWGGFKRAGVEIDRTFVRGPIDRIEVGGAMQRRKNPAYEQNDDRRRLWARAEHATGPVRLGTTTGWQRISFADVENDIRTFGVDAAFDTRVDPVLPRNAVYVGASWERVFFDGRDAIDRTRVDGRGYIGVWRQHVLVLRAMREDASAAQPLYLRSLLGGWSSLRGFKAGSFSGDTMVAGSVEWRIPLNSPLQIARLGVSIFVDAGTAYEKGERFRDQDLRIGSGGSLWLSVAAFRMSFSVAHGRGSGTRVNFGGGLTF
jgi:outer membrane protein assembly factor BamA